jgi:hypothetical protein
VSGYGTHDGRWISKGSFNADSQVAQLGLAGRCLSFSWWAAAVVGDAVCLISQMDLQKIGISIGTLTDAL